MNASLPEIYLARHGETAWTLTGQFTGNVDLPLTPAGEVEAEWLGERLRDLEFSSVASSPLVRARSTAERAGFGAGLRVDPDLSEWNYGRYEGRRLDEVHAERPGWSLFRDGCPGGESITDVERRADRVVERLRCDNGRVLLFGHGHFFRVLAARWLGLPVADGARLVLSTGAVSVLGYEHALDSPALRLWNEIDRAKR